jgi:formyltetrahydrofolate deformylase
MTAITSPSFILTLSCQDRRGIVHAVSGFLTERTANITEAAQFGDPEAGRFFMRVVFTMEGPTVGLQDLRTQFSTVASEFQMDWRIVDATARMPTVIMVSQQGHCLHDLLLRWHTGLLPIDVKAIVSNHPDFQSLAASYGVAFHHIPVTADTKAGAEAALLDVMAQSGAELLILARYMQILSTDLCRQLEGRAINIHHSFLPGFKGAKPYYQAHARGVKLIGATAHYVTGSLDEGPIIEQDVERADHAMSPAALTAVGRDVESVVLARAVMWHAEHRVIPNGGRTVVFR